MPAPRSKAGRRKSTMPTPSFTFERPVTGGVNALLLWPAWPAAGPTHTPIPQQGRAQRLPRFQAPARPPTGRNALQSAFPCVWCNKVVLLLVRTHAACGRRLVPRRRPRHGRNARRVCGWCVNLNVAEGRSSRRASHFFYCLCFDSALAKGRGRRVLLRARVSPGLCVGCPGLPQGSALRCPCEVQTTA